MRKALFSPSLSLSSLFSEKKIRLNFDRSFFCSHVPIPCCTAQASMHAWYSFSLLASSCPVSVCADRCLATQCCAHFTPVRPFFRPGIVAKPVGEFKSNAEYVPSTLSHSLLFLLLFLRFFERLFSTLSPPHPLSLFSLSLSLFSSLSFFLSLVFGDSHLPVPRTSLVPPSYLLSCHTRYTYQQVRTNVDLLTLIQVRTTPVPPPYHAPYHPSCASAGIAAVAPLLSPNVDLRSG